MVMLKKLITSDMRHRKTYMHTNFQQTRIGRSVKTVHTNLFAKKMASGINLQLPIVIVKQELREAYEYFFFQNKIVI